MNIIFEIDTVVLGLLCNPNSTQLVIDCDNWFYQLMARGARLVTSDICDYEVRRGLILESMIKKYEYGIDELNQLRGVIDFLPLDIEVMKMAAYFWAKARYKHSPTADIKNIDADMIICAHFKLLQLNNPGQRVVIATENIRDLSRFADAALWRNITMIALGAI